MDISKKAIITGITFLISSHLNCYPKKTMFSGKLKVNMIKNYPNNLRLKHYNLL